MMDINIKDIKAGMKNLNVVFIVLDVGHVINTKENRELRSCKVADQTAAINVSIWDEPSQLISTGDIIKMTRGYATVFRDCLTLYVGKTGEIHKIGEFCMVFNEQLDMSAPNPALNQQLVNSGGGAAPYAPTTGNSILVNSNGPAAPSAPLNNGARSTAPSSVPQHKPLPTKNQPSAMYNNNSDGGNGNNNKSQSGRSNSRGRGSSSRR